MSHAVEQMMFVGKTPWHGLGNVLEDNPTISDAMVAAGLDWEVGLKDLVTADDNIPVNARATYRKSDNSILGVVGPRYTPLQNKDAFDWFQPFIDANECSLHTAGSLHSGRKVWVLAQLNRDNSTIVKNDEVCKFALLSNSHDGTNTIRVGFTPIRVVCANTMAMAHSKTSGSKLIRIRHTRSSKINLDNVRNIMNNVNADFEATAEQFRFLASKSFNQKDVTKFVKVMLEVDKTLDDDLKTRTKNTIDEIMALIEGPEQSMSGVKGTWWAAYNGYNSYLNYNYGRSADNRLDSLWFGVNANDNVKALKTATEFAMAV